jgi:hypothetical protein
MSEFAAGVWDVIYTAASFRPGGVPPVDAAHDAGHGVDGTVQHRRRRREARAHADEVARLRAEAAALRAERQGR